MTLTPFLSIFQFHKGTIKTLAPPIFFERFVVFQFHKGTIKTHVREEQMLPLDYFNSIKVQLKLLRRQRNTTIASEFQFHKGTIKTILQSGLQLEWLISIP